MLKRKQLYRHNPEKGEYGDCWRTVIANMLNIAPETVPHFVEQSEKDPELDCDVLADSWLKENFGMGLVRMGLLGFDSTEALLDYMDSATFGAHYILMGESANGCNHVVVCQGNQIVWDPSLDDSGIVGPVLGEEYYTVYFLVHPSL